MSKQELAESMAEFVELGVFLGRVSWQHKLIPVKDFFFSACGFFAVWDKLDEIHKGAFMIGFWIDVVSRIYTQKQNRYTAFYTVVHEIKNHLSEEKL